MNSPQESNDSLDDHNTQAFGAYGYIIVVSIGILIVLIVISYFYNIYTRIRAGSNHRNHSRSGANARSTRSDLQGLDKTMLVRYPELLYSEVKIHESDCSSSGCSICLQDYKDIDLLRQLPECGHFFHLKCVDPWLMLHPTCPICRNSPLSTPLATPDVVAVPLTAR